MPADALSPLPPFPLRSLLEQQLSAGWQANPAMRQVVGDYARHHLVIAVAAGFFALVSLALSAALLRRLRPGAAARGRATRLERAVCLSLGLGAALLTAVLAVISGADATNALDPLHGFTPLVRALPAPSGPAAHQLAAAFRAWIESGSARLPGTLRHAVAGRLSWQAPKAAISGVLLVVLAAVSVAALRQAIRRSGGGGLTAGSLAALGECAALLALAAAVLFCTNLAGSLAPVALTLNGL